MGSSEIRIGIVGAGQISRKRHLPGFRELPGVKVRGVCNLRRESSNRIAREFDIPQIYPSWENLIEDPNIDAVVIGTWPYMHCPITLAALEAGKHVLTQARMAMNAREAQRMYDKSREHPDLTAMVVPSPYGLVGDAYVRSLVNGDYLGTMREVHVTGFSTALADKQTPLDWRQITKYSGFNTLNLGILYESVSRWISPVINVRANSSKLIPFRTDSETGRKARVGVADSVQVMTEQKDGSVGVFRISGVLQHVQELSVLLCGSHGTLYYDFAREELKGAQHQANTLLPMPIPADMRGGWQVESDFIEAIRGERKVTHTSFGRGAQYMQFTEAVARSSRHQNPVELPLKEFSNPSL